MTKRASRFIGLFTRFTDLAAAKRFATDLRTKGQEAAFAYWRFIDGDCLRPYFVTGDMVMIDADREPKDGDLVLVAMRYRRDGILGCGSIKVAESVKKWRVIDGERRLCAADGSVSADAHEVRGTVVGWNRPRWWRRPSVKSMKFEAPATA